MRIVLAKHCGFCYGVKRAVEMAGKCIRSEQQPDVHTLGPIIHNPQMVEKLEEKGIRVAAQLADITAGTVIIRSHGVGPDIYRQAEEKGLTVVDATCPHVRKAQKAAEQLLAEGYEVIVVGERHHPEVKSIVAWSGDAACVIETPAEAEALSYRARLGVVAQTTFSGDVFQEIVAILQQRCAEMKVNRTICNATELRQSEAVELAGKVDIVVVVGGKNSANTSRLAQICEQAGCRTYHVETADELEEQWFENVKTVGITAGASTPDWIIEEVKDTVQQFEQGFGGECARVEKGNVVLGKVISVRPTEVFVDIGYKAEGVIALTELAYPVPEMASTVVAEGDVIQVVVLNTDTADGMIQLSKVKADHILAWEMLQQALENAEPVECYVTEVVKGGVAAAVCGLRGFIPASQIDAKFVEDLAVFVGQRLDCLPLEVERDQNRIVLSRKVLLQREREKREKEVYASLEIGQTKQGTVSRIAAFGAFVDIGGIDGLVHISDLSWQRVKSPEEVVQVGDQVEVTVLKVDAAAKKVSLGMKQVQRDPWYDQAALLQTGSIVSGTVSKVLKVGAIVALPNGLEGFVHISEAADHHIARLEEALSVGQAVTAKVLTIDEKNKKISLSISQAQAETERAQYQPFLCESSELGATIGDKLGHLLKKFND